MQLNNYILRVKLERKIIEFINAKEISKAHLEGLNTEAIHKWYFEIHSKSFFNLEILNLLNKISKDFGYAKDISMPIVTKEINEDNLNMAFQKVKELFDSISI